jgi:hypothetical protein
MGKNKKLGKLNIGDHMHVGQGVSGDFIQEIQQPVNTISIKNYNTNRNIEGSNNVSIGLKDGRKPSKSKHKPKNESSSRNKEKLLF